MCIDRKNIFLPKIFIEICVRKFFYYLLTLSPMGCNPTDLLWGGHMAPPMKNVWKLKVGNETWYDT